MITKEYLNNHYYYDNGKLYSKLTGNSIGGKNGDGRIKTVINNKYYYLHRLIWIYFFGDTNKFIDHIDRDLSNNCIENLREADPSQSSCNRLEVGKSGFKGVDKYGKKWRAKIRYKNKYYHIGYFKTPEEASSAYQLMAETLHKEFACY